VRPDRALARLQEHQAQVARVLAEARPLLRDEDASHLKALALARWQLLRVLREYQLFKHSEIFDPMIAAGAVGRADTARRLKGRCLDIAAAFAAYVQRWSLTGPARDWTAYTAEALAMADRIDRFMMEELVEVRALLAGVERTRRP